MFHSFLAGWQLLCLLNLYALNFSRLTMIGCGVALPILAFVFFMIFRKLFPGHSAAKPWSLWLFFPLMVYECLVIYVVKNNLF